MSKRAKTAKALHLLSIGEFFVCLGMLYNFGFIFRWFSFAAFFTLIGTIIVLIVIIKLRKINNYFLISFIAFLISSATNLAIIIINMVSYFNNTITPSSFLLTSESIIYQICSILFTFGLLRGCGLVATGSKKSKFGKHMIIINTCGNFINIALNIINFMFFTNNEEASKIISFVVTAITIFVELYLCVFLFRTYLKVKAKANASSEK